MASEVTSGAANASYTNNTGQNVRLIINYMSNVTSMTWSSSSGGNVNISASAATIGKDVKSSLRVNGEVRALKHGERGAGSAAARGYDRSDGYEVDFSEKAIFLQKSNGERMNIIVPQSATSSSTFAEGLYNSGTNSQLLDTPSGNLKCLGFYGNAPGSNSIQSNYVFVPTTITDGSSNFPLEIMLASGQSFSAVCGAFNLVAIKEDGN